MRIGDRYYVDGGLLGVLPLWAAGAMGATRVLALNALPVVPSRVARGAARLAQRFAAMPSAAPPARIVELAPSAPLGRMKDALRWNPDAVRRCLDTGSADARKLLAGSSCGGVFD